MKTLRKRGMNDAHCAKSVAAVRSDQHVVFSECVSEPAQQAYFTHSIKMIGGCSIKSDQYWRSASPVISGESSGSYQVICLNPEVLKLSPHIRLSGRVRTFFPNHLQPRST